MIKIDQITVTKFHLTLTQKMNDARRVQKVQGPKPRGFVSTCALPEDVGEKVLKLKINGGQRLRSLAIGSWFVLMKILSEFLNLCDYVTQQNMIVYMLEHPFHQRNKKQQ